MIHAQLHGVLCIAFVLCSVTATLVPVSEPAVVGVRYIALYLALTVIMLGAWRTSPPTRQTRSVVVAGILARLAMLAASPYTTHDVERYLWDGRVLLEGFDPYRLAPEASSLAALRAYWPTPAEHAAYPTLYPPGALALFAIAASAGPAAAPWAWKILVTIASVGGLVVMTRLAKACGHERNLALVALSPLLVLEGGVGGHVDSFAVLAFAAALLALHARRTGMAGILIGTAVLVKPVAGVALLPLTVGLRRHAGSLIAGALGAITAGYGLALALGLHPVGSLAVFFERWRFGSPIFAGLGLLTTPPVAIAVLSATAMLGFAGAAIAARRGQLPAAIVAAFTIPLLVSPVVFPWYLMTLVPTLILIPSAFVLLWMTTLPLTYEVLGPFLATGAWTPAAWPLVVVVAGWIVGLGIDAHRHRELLGTSALRHRRRGWRTADLPASRVRGRRHRKR